MTTEKVVAPDVAEGDSTEEWFNGYTSSAGVSFTVPLTSFSSGDAPLAADIVPTTGDVREILYGILEHFYAVQENRKSDSATDALTGMALARVVTIDPADNDLQNVKFTVTLKRTTGDKATAPVASPAVSGGAES
jgi:hypothetical protein